MYQMKNDNKVPHNENSAYCKCDECRVDWKDFKTTDNPFLKLIKPMDNAVEFPIDVTTGFQPDEK